LIKGFEVEPQFFIFHSFGHLQRSANPTIYEFSETFPSFVLGVLYLLASLILDRSPPTPHVGNTGSSRKSEGGGIVRQIYCAINEHLSRLN
jgi:hypothetical protein